nr:hypothetical protein [Desulfuromonadales bacterium]
PPAPESLCNDSLLDTAWRRHPDLRLVDFSFEINDLLQIGAAPLHDILAMLRPSASTALFLRRGPEVACESLQSGFLLLLRRSNGCCPPRQILPDCRPDEVEQWVEFAVAEGLLLPP